MGNVSENHYLTQCFQVPRWPRGEIEFEIPHLKFLSPLDSGLTISPEQDLPQDSTLPVEPGPSYHLVAKIYVCQLFGVIAKYLQILIEYLKVHTLKKENSETRFKCKSYVPRFKKDHILLCSWEGVVKIIYPNFKNNIEFFVCFVFRQVQFEQKD